MSQKRLGVVHVVGGRCVSRRQKGLIGLFYCKYSLSGPPWNRISRSQVAKLNFFTAEFSVPERAKGKNLGYFGACTFIRENGTLHPKFLVKVGCATPHHPVKDFPMWTYVPRNVCNDSQCRNTRNGTVLRGGVLHETGRSKGSFVKKRFRASCRVNAEPNPSVSETVLSAQQGTILAWLVVREHFCRI